MRLKAHIVLTLTIVLVMFCQIVAAAKAQEIGLVQGQNVNMREMPDTNSATIEKLVHGAEVEIFDEVDGWYRVIYNGRIGYIRNDLVFVKTLQDKIGYVNQDGINLRGGPAQSAYIVEKITAGNPVRIKQMTGDWYYALYNGKMGFVHKSVVDISKATGTGHQMLKVGMEGQEVKKVQNELATRNFITQKQVTGSYGAITRSAVMEFQKMAKLSVCDGVVGPETLALLLDPTNKIKKIIESIVKPGSGGKVNTSSVKGNVIMMDWWKGGSSVLKRSGGTAKLIDVRTGKSFNIRRYAGSNHADVTPMTANDTAIFKSIVGKWNWGRRSVWVVIGSKVYAASINCMPHAPDHNKTDNFPGHICLHFVNSRTHGGNRVDPDHQAAIKYAFSKGNNK